MPGHTAVILIGESNDGSVSGVDNPDDQQRKLRQELEKIYPARSLAWLCNRKQIRPAIGWKLNTAALRDAAWIRHGSETIKASDAMLQKLIDLRSSKVRQLTEWMGKLVTVSWSIAGAYDFGPNWICASVKLLTLTSHFSTFKGVNGGRRVQEPNG